MIRTGLVILLLAIAVFVSLRLINTSATSHPVTASTPQGANYYMLDAVVHQMNSAGQLRYRMQVAKTLHYPDDSVLLEDIQATYSPENAPPWQLSADSGKIPAGEQRMLLQGHLQLEQQRSDGSIVLTTTHAWVNPDNNRIKTSAAVTVDAPGSRLTATGMVAQLDTRHITFKHDVRAIYTP